MTLVIAHRGASADELENTLAAFRRARALAADGVELDIHASKDGVIVVHHDPELDGLPINDTPFAQLSERRLLNGEPLPRLADALAELDGLTVYVEAKALPAAADGHLFAVLDGGPTPQRYQVHSFDHRIVARLRRARPDYHYGVLACAYPQSPLHAIEDAGAQVLWQLQTMIDGALVSSAHAAGYQVVAWTVDDADRARELVGMGVDGLCTNRPDRVRTSL